MSIGGSDHFGTLAIHAGRAPDATTSAVMTPVYLTSKYAQDRSALTQALDRA